MSKFLDDGGVLSEGVTDQEEHEDDEDDEDDEDEKGDDVDDDSKVCIFIAT